MVLYLSVAQLDWLHQFQLEHYGGGQGVRDRGALEAAAARPAMTYGGEDLYPDLPGKAAALMHSLVKNHPYVDGNKRVGAHAAVVFLRVNGWDLAAESDDLEKTTMALAAGDLDVESLTVWFRQRAFQRPG